MEERSNEPPVQTALDACARKEANDAFAELDRG